MRRPRSRIGPVPLPAIFLSIGVIQSNIIGLQRFRFAAVHEQTFVHSRCRCRSSRTLASEPNLPTLPVPPVIVAAQEEPGMFDFYRHFHWFLKIHRM